MRNSSISRSGGTSRAWNGGSIGGYSGYNNSGFLFSSCGSSGNCTRTLGVAARWKGSRRSSGSTTADGGGNVFRSGYWACRRSRGCQAHWADDGYCGNGGSFSTSAAFRARNRRRNRWSTSPRATRIYGCSTLSRWRRSCRATRWTTGRSSYSGGFWCRSVRFAVY